MSGKRTPGPLTELIDELDELHETWHTLGDSVAATPEEREVAWHKVFELAYAGRRQLHPHNRAIYRLVHDWRLPLEKAVFYTDLPVREVRSRLASAMCFIANFVADHLRTSPLDFAGLLARARELNAQRPICMSDHILAVFKGDGAEMRSAHRHPPEQPLPADERMAFELANDLALGVLSPSDEAATLRRIESDPEFRWVATFAMLVWSVPRERTRLELETEVPDVDEDE